MRPGAFPQGEMCGQREDGNRVGRRRARQAPCGAQKALASYSGQSGRVATIGIWVDENSEPEQTARPVVYIRKTHETKNSCRLFRWFKGNGA